MEYTTISAINQFTSESINPALFPDTMFEVYSVPVFESGHPEYIRGKDIGSTKQIVKKDDVLICKINPRINRVWVVADESDMKNIASSEWIVVRTEEYNPEFLGWYFRSAKFKKLMMSEVAGIGGSLTRAQPKRVANYPVPIVGRNRQDEIVQNLNMIKRIIELRKSQLFTFDTLIKARFVEMFGDESEHGVPLKECCIDVRGGGTPSMQHPEYYGGNVPFIKSGDVRGDMVSAGALWLTEKALDETTAKYVPQGSVLVVNRSAALLREFRAAIAACPVVINQDIKAFIPKNDYTSEYLLWAIKIQTQLLLTKVTTVLTSHIDLKDLLELRIANASIERQKEFSAFISQVDKSKVAVQKSLNEAQLLFDSLMQKYFG